MYFVSSIITVVKHISLFFRFLFYNLYTFSSILESSIHFINVLLHLSLLDWWHLWKGQSWVYHPRIILKISLYTISWLVHKQSTNIKSIFVLSSYIYFWFMYSSALFGLMWLYNRWVGFMAMQKLALLSLVCEVC